MGGRGASQPECVAHGDQQRVSDLPFFSNPVGASHFPNCSNTLFLALGLIWSLTRTRIDMDTTVGKVKMDLLPSE